MTTITTIQLTLARGTKTLCQNLSLTIAPGDYWAVLGPNGSGKTTLLHTLCGQLKAAQGKIFLNNQPLATHSTQAIARHIGILFQDFHPAFPQTVREYCLDARFPHHALFTAGRCRKADTELLQQTLFSMQLHTFAEKNIQHLSGGEQRRAAIAALLMQAPAIFMLDEPVNHLDLQHQIKTMNIFAARCRDQHAVIMTLHDINLAARYCNKILMMFPDGTALHGSRTDMLTTSLLSRLYQHPIDVIGVDDQTYWLPRH